LCGGREALGESAARWSSKQSCPLQSRRSPSATQSGLLLWANPLRRESPAGGLFSSRLQSQLW
jgi:hypothetical protein